MADSDTVTHRFLELDGPAPIASSIQRALADAIAVLPPDVRAAQLLSVTIRDGRPELAAAFAMRESHGWTLAASVVTDFKADLEAGVYVSKVWR